MYAGGYAPASLLCSSISSRRNWLVPGSGPVMICARPLIGGGSKSTSLTQQPRMWLMRPPRVQEGQACMPRLAFHRDYYCQMV